MKRIASGLLLFLVGVSSYSQTIIDLQSVEPYLKAVQSPMVEFTQPTWEKINIGRSLLGTATQPLSEVNSDPYYNRSYLVDYLLMTKHELRNATNMHPSHEDVFVAWRLGMDEFRKIGYTVGRLKNEKVSTELSRFRLALQRFKPQEPPPLPTDGRRPVPRRLPDMSERQRR